MKDVVGMGDWEPLQLVVEPIVHAAELARFESCVVRGPGADDCAIWCSALGSDGYGRFWLYRGGPRVMVRAPRYALAASLAGKPLMPWVKALHGCNNTACVRVREPAAMGLLHVCDGSQRQNMEMMGRARRGGGRPAVRTGEQGVRARRARAVALRHAVRNGWDAEAVAAALLGSAQPTLW